MQLLILFILFSFVGMLKNTINQLIDKFYWTIFRFSFLTYSFFFFFFFYYYVLEDEMIILMKTFGY